MLTPIDIHNRPLKPAKIGGYDKKDIDDFVEEIIASYEELYNENRVLKEKITSLSEGIQYYKKMEGTLQKALVLAEKTSSETQEAAKSQADSVITEASAKAEALSRETKAEIDALRAEAQAQAEVTRAKANRELEETRNHVRKLVQSYENYRLQFKKLAEAQIEMLESDSFSIFVPELDELMNEAPSADSVLDNPGVIPINIGSPAPFEEPPVETESVTEAAVFPKSTKPTEQEQAAVEAVVEAHRKLDVKFDDLSNSIAIPISSNMGPFTDLPEEDNENIAAPLQDLKIDNSTAPSIDINIGTAIGEEIEVSMSLEPLPSSVESRNDNTIDILVNTQSLLSDSIDDIQAAATSSVPSMEKKPVVEQVAILTPTPSETSGQPAVVPISLEQPVAEPDVLELVPEPIINLNTVATETAEPAVGSMEPPLTEPDILELAPEQSAVSIPVSSDVDSPVYVSAEPQGMNIPLNFESPVEAPAEPQGMSIPINFESPVEAPAEPQGMSIPINFESPAEAPAEPQGMSIPIDFESPAEAPAEPQGMSIPINFESPAEAPAEPQGMSISINFESPAEAPAEPQSMSIPINFESPSEAPAEPQGMSIPISFESPEDLQTEPQGMNMPIGFEVPEDLKTESPEMSIPLQFETPDNSPSVAPITNIPMIEPMAEPQPTATNGLIDTEPVAAVSDAFIDMSAMFDSPVQELSEESAAMTQQIPDNGLIDSGTSNNGIISDAFIQPATMFESPVDEIPQEQPSEPEKNPNDAMLDINPFNFIDPE